MNLFFLRHGESEANLTKTFAGQSETRLTALGIRQAKEAGAEIKSVGIDFDTIISSPLSRALDTARIVADITGYATTDIEIDKATMERSGGIGEGMSQTDFFALTEQEQVKLGAESFEELGKRAKEFLEKVTSAHADETVLVVSHATFGEVLKAMIKFDDYNRWPDVGRLPNAKIIKLI